MARQVMVDLDELDHLISAATRGRSCLTDAVADLIETISHTPAHAAAGEDPLEFVARALLQRLDPGAPGWPLVTHAETDYATRQVEKDLTGALLLACRQDRRRSPGRHLQERHSPHPHSPDPGQRPRQHPERPWPGDAHRPGR